MASRKVWSGRVLVGAVVTMVLIAALTLPGLAAPKKTMSFQVNTTGRTDFDFAAAMNTAPADGSSVSIWVRATNTTPGTGNPNSLRVTAQTGFVITDADIEPQPYSSKTNPAIPPVLGAGGAYVDINGIAPLQSGQYITVLITATTPTSCSSPSQSWAGKLWTGTPVGSGQPFETTSTFPTTTTLTAGSCPTAPSVSISSNPAASGGVVKFLNGDGITLTATASGTPAPSVTWQSSTASDCLMSTSATFTNTGATGASYAFTVATADNGKCFRAKADNGVNPPGVSNVIQLSLSMVTLEFVTAPHDAATNTDITGTDFNPSGDDVQVALKVDGSTSGAFDGSTVTITDETTGSDHIVNGTATLAGGGFATFDSLQIETAGDYNLSATVTGGPSTNPVAITITPTGVCPGPDGVSGQEDFTTGDFGVEGQGTLNISDLTSNECLGLDVSFSSDPESGVQQWDILVNKLTVGPKLTGYATWTWDLPGNDPVPWTEVKWKANVGGTLQETDFVDLPRCNADAVTDPLPDPTLPNQAYVDLFPTVSTSLGPLTAGVCMYDSALHVSGDTYREVQKIAIFEDPSGRK